MNWIILIVAGLFETGFAFCLGKMKEATGAEYCWWGAGFLLSLALSMTLLAKGDPIAADRHGLSGVDGHRCRGNGAGGNSVPERTGDLPADLLPACCSSALSSG